MIYFDNAATTKPSEIAIEIFNKISAEEYFNPSASYSVAFDLYKKIEQEKKELLKILGDEQGKIIFTSGATESNNIAILGSTFLKQKRYLFSMGEHPSVYNTAIHLKNMGYNVEFIPLQRNGQVDYDKLEEMLADGEVCFVSTMLVSNETGAINDIKRIRNLIDKYSLNCIYHVDAVQAFCKINFNVIDSNVNLCSISAHKINGVKGVGALYISKNTKLKNINYGGDQENGLRSGTVNAASNLSFCAVAKEKYKLLDKNYNYILDLKNYFIDKLKNLDSKNIICASDESCSPFIISLMFVGNRGETLMRFLSSKNIFVGTGSACSTNKVGNRILESMGYSKKEVMGAIRISFNSQNTKEEIDNLFEQIKYYLKNINK